VAKRSASTAREQRLLQHALQLRDAFDGRVGARQHDDAGGLLGLREHAVRSSKCVRDPMRETAGGTGGERGHRGWAQTR
jgi:hypothetical protein